MDIVRLVCAAVVIAAAVQAELRPISDGTPLRNVDSFDIHSEHVGIDYRIYVALPPQYSEPDSTFPVIYNLDSDITFGMMTDISRMLRLDSLIPATIVVGIAYNKSEADWRANRTRDLTPTAVDWAEGSGGARQFLAFVEEELMPAIDARYRTNTDDRVLTGASWAGLFGLYAMFERPGLFHRILAAVPSVHWDDRYLLKREAAYAEEHDDMSLRLYISPEGFESRAWSHEYWSQAWAFTAALRMREYANLHLKMAPKPGEFHASAQPISFTHGLLYLFGRTE